MLLPSRCFNAVLVGPIGDPCAMLTYYFIKKLRVSDATLIYVPMVMIHDTAYRAYFEKVADLMLF